MESGPTPVADKGTLLNAPHPAAPATLHFRLRQATKMPHRVLDHHAVLAPLLSAELTLDQYAGALEALYGVHVHAEAGILGILEEHPTLFDYGSRRKLPALEADLARLGRIPVCLPVRFPVLLSVGNLVGALYTIEGASQGGQMILRGLKQLPFHDLPVSFFTGYGALSRQRWDEFLGFAETHCPEAEQDRALESAIAMFEAICEYLDAYARYSRERTTGRR
jgi:heme oxygenase (biliverdin-IX-beta and delta-forming)